MGNNSGYSIVERQVINLYDADKLDLEVLDILANANAGYDLDSGGSEGLETNDGLNFEQVCVKLIDPSIDVVAIRKLEEDDDNYEGKTIYDHFGELTDDRWGW